ncbi:hypothetical protein DRN86_04750, partial [Candidatus Geothermarchaeota archaeon]
MPMSSSLDYVKKDLLKALHESVSRNLGEGILLSGGLDTSVLAYLLCRYLKPKAITVSYGPESPDLHYSKIIARFLGLKHYIKIFDEKEALRAIKNIIK